MCSWVEINCLKSITSSQNLLTLPAKTAITHFGERACNKLFQIAFRLIYLAVFSKMSWLPKIV